MSLHLESRHISIVGKLHLLSLTLQVLLVELWRPNSRMGGSAELQEWNPFNTFHLCSYLGITPPISTQESNEREKEMTTTLMEELRRQNTFESEEESRTRYATFSLSILSYVHSTWFVWVLSHVFNFFGPYV